MSSLWTTNWYILANQNRRRLLTNGYSRSVHVRQLHKAWQIPLLTNDPAITSLLSNDKSILRKNAQKSNQNCLNPFRRTGPNGKMLDLWRNSSWVWIFMSSLWTTNSRILANQKSRRLSKEWLFSIHPCASITQDVANTLIDEWSSFDILITKWKNYIAQERSNVQSLQLESFQKNRTERQNVGLMT